MKKNYKKNFAAIIAATLVLSAVGLVGCGNTSSKSTETKNESTTEVTQVETKTEEAPVETTTEVAQVEEKNYEGLTIRIGCGTDIVKYDLAEYLGYWEDEFGKDGIKVEAVRFSNGADYVDGIATGSVDLGVYGDQPTIAGITAGKNLKIIGRTGDDTAGYKIIISQDSTIDSIQELKGRKVAAKFGTNPHKIWIQVLKDAGLTIDDVEVVNLSSSESFAALKSGEVEAVAVYSGGGADISEYKILKEYTEVAKSIHVISGSTEFLETYPELVARALLVWQREGEWINNNHEEAIKTIAEIGGIGENNARVIVEGEVWNVQWDEEDAQVIDFTSQWLYESDVLAKQLESKDMVDTSFLRLAGLTVGEGITY